MYDSDSSADVPLRSLGREGAKVVDPMESNRRSRRSKWSMASSDERPRATETADPRPRHRATVCSRVGRTRTCGVPRTASRRPREPTRPSLDWPTKVDVSGLHPDERTRRFCATLACAADKWRPLCLIRLHSHGGYALFSWRSGVQDTQTCFVQGENQT